MPITPYTTPLKTEYKPLGIDKFFEPLSQMQSKYDVAKTQIDDTRFKLARMSQDDSSAAPILEDSKHIQLVILIILMLLQTKKKE